MEGGRKKKGRGRRRRKRNWKERERVGEEIRKQESGNQETEERRSKDT